MLSGWAGRCLCSSLPLAGCGHSQQQSARVTIMGDALSHEYIARLARHFPINRLPMVLQRGVATFVPRRAPRMMHPGYPRGQRRGGLEISDLLDEAGRGVVSAANKEPVPSFSPPWHSGRRGKLDRLSLCGLAAYADSSYWLCSAHPNTISRFTTHALGRPRSRLCSCSCCSRSL